MKLNVIVPDFNGEEIETCQVLGRIISRIHVRFPSARVFPVLNGPAGHWDAKAAQFAGMKWLHPLVSHDHERGVVGAMQVAYEYLSSEHASNIIVKIDNAEHPVDHIEVLAAAAEHHHAAIAELDLSKGCLVPGTYDDWIHREVFPTMYTVLTNGNLGLSCAHGFQAFSATCVRDALPIANRIIAEAERLSGRKLRWGFDAAMAIGAVKSGHAPQMVPVAAEVVRDRPPEKINSQLENHLILLAAVARLDLF